MYPYIFSIHPIRQLHSIIFAMVCIQCMYILHPVWERTSNMWAIRVYMYILLAPHAGFEFRLNTAMNSTGSDRFKPSWEPDAPPPASRDCNAASVTASSSLPEAICINWWMETIQNIFRVEIICILSSCTCYIAFYPYLNTPYSISKYKYCIIHLRENWYVQSSKYCHLVTHDRFFDDANTWKKGL